MSDFDTSTYLSYFLDEVDEQLQLLDESVLKLENDPTNESTIQDIFRVAHTLKGSSAAMGFDKMKDFMHHLENVFENIRQRKMLVTPNIIAVIFNSIDLLKEFKLAITEGRMEDLDISYSLNELKLLTNNDQEIKINKIDYNSTHEFVIASANEQGFNTYELHFQLDKDCAMKNVRAFMISNKLLEFSEVIASNPTTDQIDNEDEISDEITIAVITNYTLEDVKLAFENFSEVKLIDGISLSNKKEIEKPVEVRNEKTTIVSKTAQKVGATVRVDIDKLEHLMNLVGELVIDQTRLADVRGRFADKIEKLEDEFEVLDDVTNHISRIISELQEGMMKTRMLPIEQLFNRFPRMVRDTSIKANKEIQFEMLGKETELDRTLIEEISDPIIHLLRNAIDHGIEEAQERLVNGKKEKGTVKLSAAHEENHIVISIEDDGRGIDIEKIKQKAIEKGVLTASEAEDISDKEAMHLIFNSGLSTAKEITDISGRGVGMDIVKSHIEKLNGIIDIQSSTGIGTKFTIKLPLTLAIIRSLLVKLGEQTFAIPLANVLEIIRIDKGDIQIVNNQEVGLIRGRVLPLVRLKEKLHITENTVQQKKNREFVVIVGVADRRIGIIADRTVGNQEIVIKSLGQYIGNPPYITGATIMGDGDIALILDVALIARELGAEMNQEEDLLLTKQIEEEKQIVTFKLDKEEYGLEIQRAKDIIIPPKITAVADSVEGLLGLINLRGKMLPVIDLREKIGVTQKPLTKKARIIIVEYEYEDIGFLVDEVTQVLKVNNVDIEIPTKTNQYNESKLIKGISKINDRVILILEFNKIVQSYNFDNLITEDNYLED